MRQCLGQKARSAIRCIKTGLHRMQDDHATGVSSGDRSQPACPLARGPLVLIVVSLGLELLLSNNAYCLPLGDVKRNLSYDEGEKAACVYR